MADIFERLLNLPSAWLPVSKPDGNGSWDLPGAPLRLKEGDQGQVDEALLEVVDPAVLRTPTVAAAIAMFGNYRPWEGEADVDLADEEHAAEVESFLNAVMATEVVGLAADHLMSIAPDTFPDAGKVRDWARKIWFEPFTNEFALPEPYCSGFEHVFVGEVQQNAIPGDDRMDIGGYHSWIKYVTDSEAGLVRYFGHDYPASVAAAGKASVREASVIMTWTVGDTEYLKNPGGFFVGDLPELQIALGMVAMHHLLAGDFSNVQGSPTSRRIPLGGDVIELVTYPQTVRQGQARKNGPYIRSMYPKFRGAAATPVPGLVPPLPHTPKNDGPIRLVAALPNPPGTDETGEWIEIRNATLRDLMLDDWTLRDAQQRSQALSGPITAGATIRVKLPRTDPGSPQLSNSGGWIFLFERDERLAAVPFPPTGTGEVVRFE